MLSRSGGGRFCTLCVIARYLQIKHIHEGRFYKQTNINNKKIKYKTSQKIQIIVKNVQKHPLASSQMHSMFHCFSIAYNLGGDLKISTNLNRLNMVAN